MSHIHLVSVRRSVLKKYLQKHAHLPQPEVLRQFGLPAIMFAQIPERILPCNFPKIPDTYVPVGADYNGLTTSDPAYIDAYTPYGKGSYRQQTLLVMKEYDHLDDGLVILTTPSRMIMLD